MKEECGSKCIEKLQIIKFETRSYMPGVTRNRYTQMPERSEVHAAKKNGSQPEQNLILLRKIAT